MELGARLGRDVAFGGRGEGDWMSLDDVCNTVSEQRSSSSSPAGTMLVLL